jgi:cytochrome c oxidase accessory protein FixG
MSIDTQTRKPEPGGPALLQPEERVLSTLEADGSRRWLKPRLSKGRYLTRRRIVAYALIAVFTLLPYIPINGKPAVLLDVANRSFTFFGYTFLPTDTLLLALFLVAVLVGIFLLTALFGRVWCGWACPQTVYMEFVYRPIERLFDGTVGRGGKGRRNVAGWRKVAQYVCYFVVSFYLAHTFLAYFVGVENLREWVFGSPLDHPAAFAIVAAVTGLMLFDFAYFREQLCIVACPYGRFQSVLLDRKSLIVSYDERRGEPRAKTNHKPDAEADCIDCHLCVVTCPTGIDIRDGLQMECIHCTQCIDACDMVMDTIKRPRGLIRYSSQDAIEGQKPRLLRARTVLYPVIMTLVVALFVVVLSSQTAADVQLIREKGAPFVQGREGILNRMKLKITNRTESDATYRVALVDGDSSRLTLDGAELFVPAGEARTAGLVIQSDRSVFTSGSADVPLRVYNDSGFEMEINAHILGPWSAGGSTP